MSLPERTFQALSCQKGSGVVAAKVDAQRPSVYTPEQGVYGGPLARSDGGELPGGPPLPYELASVVVAVGGAHDRVDVEVLGLVVIEEYPAVVVELEDRHW